MRPGLPPEKFSNRVGQAAIFRGLSVSPGSEFSPRSSLGLPHVGVGRSGSAEVVHASDGSRCDPLRIQRVGLIRAMRPGRTRRRRSDQLNMDWIMLQPGSNGTQCSSSPSCAE